MSHDLIARIERGDFERLSMHRLVRLATALGLEVSLALFPTGSPVRDAGHLALLGRLGARLHRALTMRLEVPMPTPGDLRNADALIRGAGVHILVEAETHVGDFQAVLRRARDKQRDLGGPRLILLPAIRATIGCCWPRTPPCSPTFRSRRVDAWPHSGMASTPAGIRSSDSEARRRGERAGGGCAGGGCAG